MFLSQIVATRKMPRFSESSLNAYLAIRGRYHRGFALVMSKGPHWGTQKRNRRSVSYPFCSKLYAVTERPQAKKEETGFGVSGGVVMIVAGCFNLAMVLSVLWLLTLMRGMLTTFHPL
jgi:hypothetical protein